MRLDAGEVRLLNKDGRTLNLAVSQGANSEFLAEEQTVGVGECACGPANDEVSVVTVQDSFRDPRVTRPACQRQGYRGVVCIPLKAKGKALGILEMHSREPLQLNARDLAILTAIGDQLGLAIENAQLYNDMERRVADLSEKVQHLAIVQERERISREMHDGLAQALGLLNLRVRMVERLLAAKQLDQAQAELGQMEAIIDDTYADVREGITDLRLAVPQGQGFIAMLQEYVEQFGRRNRLATEFRVGNGQCPVHLSPIQEVQLIRIVQEALSNVRKHARARKVWVTLTPHPCPPPLAEEGEGRGRLTVHVQDDGVGFDPQEAQQRAGRNFGLAIMEERAEDLGGTFTLETRPGSGTTVTVEIPYEARRDESDADPPGR
jgi:two-component system nitrate/nitrite sensor histidine kinase NarX